MLCVASPTRYARFAASAPKPEFRIAEQTTRRKKEKSMKLTRALSLVCIFVFVLFAASTPAQDQTAAPLPRLPMHLHTANDAANDTTSVGEGPLQVKRSAVPLATEACKYTFTTGSGTTF